MFDLLRDKAESTIFHRIQSTSESDLVSIKIPAQLPPYAIESDGYEWTDGEIDYGGVTYKYVKRKIFRDSIEFLCLPHHDKMKVENAREEFFRLCYDLNDTSGDAKKSPVSIQLKPFHLEAPVAGFMIWQSLEAGRQKQNPVFNESSLFPPHHLRLEKPPQV